MIMKLNYAATILAATLALPQAYSNAQDTGNFADSPSGFPGRQLLTRGRNCSDEA